MGWFGPSGDCGCCGEDCPECTDYGSDVDYTFEDIVHASTARGYANAIKGPNVPSPVTNFVRWAYWTGSTDLFNGTGTYTLPALSGTVPNRGSFLLNHSRPGVTISVWISEIVSSASAKPAEANFYEYSVDLTLASAFSLYDNCGDRQLFVTIGRVTPSTITAVSPFESGASSPAIATPSVIADWISESSLTDCSYPIVASDNATSSSELQVSINSTTLFPYFSTYTINIPFLPVGGTATLELSP